MADKTVAKALKYFNEDHNCAQTVFRTVLEEYDTYFEEATAAMAGLGGGIGLEGNVCGAVTGAVAALGVLNSQRFKDFEEHKNESYVSGAKFIYKFKKKFGTVICNELTGVTMADKDARQEAIDNGTFHKTCPKFVEEAVRIVIDMQNKV